MCRILYVLHNRGKVQGRFCIVESHLPAHNDHCVLCRPQMIEAIHYELECALDDPAAEVARLLDMQKLTYSPLSSSCAQCLEEGKAWHAAQVFVSISPWL